MILGPVLQGRRYDMQEYAAAALLVAGVSLFCLGDVAVAPNFHIAGVGLITLALFADAATSNFEEKRFFRVASPVSQAEVIFYSSALSSLAGFAVLLPTQELGPAWRHSRANGVVVPLLSAAAVCGYLRCGAALRAVYTSSAHRAPPPQRHLRAAAHQILRRHKHRDRQVAAQGAVHRAVVCHLPEAGEQPLPGRHGGHLRQPGHQLPAEAPQGAATPRARSRLAADCSDACRWLLCHPRRRRRRSRNAELNAIHLFSQAAQ